MQKKLRAAFWSSILSASDADDFRSSEASPRDPLPNTGASVDLVKRYNMDPDLWGCEYDTNRRYTDPRAPNERGRQ